MSSENMRMRVRMNRMQDIYKALGKQPHAKGNTPSFQQDLQVFDLEPVLEFTIEGKVVNRYCCI